MKIIALMPVRNEALILPTTLRALSTFCDHIIISMACTKDSEADEQFTDDSLSVARSFPKVQIAPEPNFDTIGTADEVARHVMLDTFRSYDGNNLGLCVDADELTPPLIFKGLRDAVTNLDRSGTIYSFWWVQLWKQLNRYRDDQSMWSNIWKSMAFHDDRKMSYPQIVGRYHASRTPVAGDGFEPVRLEGFPILHLQWVYWERTQYKQSRYRMLEYVKTGFTEGAELNQKYAGTLDDKKERLSPAPPEWFEGVTLSPQLNAPEPNWHRDEIIKMFNRYGIERFEPLQIWHLKELRELFRKQVGRKPVSQTLKLPVDSFSRKLARRVLPAPARRILKRAIYGRQKA